MHFIVLNVLLYRMSVNQTTPTGKPLKGKRNSMTRPQSAIDEVYTSFRSDLENDTLAPAYRIRLHNLFRQIEKEFELLYQENQTRKFVYF